MERQRAARAMGPVRADRLRHVRDAEDAIIAVGVSVPGRNLAPILRSGRELDLAAKIVRVGHDERSRLAVDLDWRVLVPRHIETHGHRDRRAAREHERSRDVRGNLDRDARSGEGLARDEAFASGARRDAADARHGAEEVDEVGDVVRPHVEHGAAALEVVETGIRMPAFMARTQEEGRAADRPANEPFVDALARGLMRASEERVGR